MAFHNPYHFVSVENGGRTSDLEVSRFKNSDLSTHPHVSHDRYVKDTFSGRIVCSIIAKTSFVVGDEQNRPDKESPAFVEQFKIDGKPGIPTTTLRGLFSNIVETASNSTLRVLENEYYSYRKKADNPLKKLGMVYVKDDKLEILEICGFDREFPDKCIKLNLNSPQKFSTYNSENKDFYYLKKGERHRTTTEPIPEDKLPEAEKNLSETAKSYKKGILRIMQDGNRDLATHKYELFLEWGNAKSYEILPEAIECFNEIADIQTEKNKDEELPYHPIGTKRNLNPKVLKNKLRLKPLDLVYFRAEGNRVVELAFSSIWRDLVGKKDKITQTKKPDKTFDFFRDKELLPFNKDRKFITLAEQMFGFVQNNAEGKSQDNNLSLAGRIYPSPARWEGILESGVLNKTTTDYYDLSDAIGGWTLLKILDSPKPPSPSMYFKSGYIAKDKLNATEHEPQGRKFYLHNQTNEGRPWKSNKNENLKQKMEVKPVKEGTMLFFHIDFNNFSRIELGALIYALNPNSEFQHKVGLGKPIGLGSIKVEVAGVFLIDRIKRYSSNGLFSSRYHNCWKNEEIELPNRYSIESNCEVNLKRDYVNQLTEAFKTATPHLNQIREILETIGNPNSVKHDVHYPTISINNIQQNVETEGFRWFVANETVPNQRGERKMKIDKRDYLIGDNRHNLKPITQNGIIEPLEEIKVHSIQNDKRR